MSVLYKILEDTRETSKTKGQFYARAVHIETVGLAEIAAQIEANVSVKHSDVAAVLIELVNVMTKELGNSNVVRLDGLGTFKIGLKTKMASKREDFTAPRNIVGARVNFRPAYTVDTKNGYKHDRTFLRGISVRDLATVGAKKEAEEGGDEPNP